MAQEFKRMVGWAWRPAMQFSPRLASGGNVWTSKGEIGRGSLREPCGHRRGERDPLKDVGVLEHMRFVMKGRRGVQKRVSKINHRLRLLTLLRGRLSRRRRDSFDFGGGWFRVRVIPGGVSFSMPSTSRFVVMRRSLPGHSLGVLAGPEEFFFHRVRRKNIDSLRPQPSPCYPR